MTLSQAGRAWLLALTLAAVSVPALAQVTAAPARERPHCTVLVLHSYHPGFQWTDDLARGIGATFGASRYDVDIRTEYLDAKRIGDAAHLTRMADYLDAKYRGVTVDLILSTDDAALSFLARIHDRLFPGTPVVFCGVNDSRMAAALPRSTFTGVIEVFSDAPLLDLARRHHPSRRHVTVIGDNSEVGSATLAQFRTLALGHPDLTFEFLDGRTVPFDTILATLRRATQPGIVITSAFGRDASGSYLRLSDAHARLADASADPIYSSSISDLGQGIVGGSVSTGEHHGGLAASLALTILDDSAPASLPIVEDHENQYVFDAEQLDRWGLTRASLPPGSLVINEPTGFYYRYRSVIWGTAAFVALQTAVIAALVASIVRRRRAEQRTAAANRQLQAEMTERRRAEDERERLASQLVHAQKMEAVGLLAGGVAHDFNNLLSVILGHSGLAAEGLPETHPAQADLEEIRRAGERAASLTRQLLAVSRRQVLQPVALNLGEATAQTTTMLRRLIGERITLVWRPPQEATIAKVDPGQFEQVLLNLAVNARDAMPDGGTLTIDVDTVHLDAPEAGRVGAPVPGAYVRLRVRDTGQGMAPDTQARVFEPFFTTKPKGKGTGLGLSIVYGIVAQSGGTITIDSTIGVGTTVAVLLPKVGAGDGAGPAGAGPAHARDTRGTEAVLVVEDEAAVRSMVRRILADSGYRVDTAEDGSEALRMMEGRDRPFDLVLSDVVMPHLGGIALAAWVADHSPSTRVVLMSGYADDTSRPDGRIPADARFLAKPFDAATLTAAVRRALDERPVTPSSP